MEDLTNRAKQLAERNTRKQTEEALSASIKEREQIESNKRMHMEQHINDILNTIPEEYHLPILANIEMRKFQPSVEETYEVNLQQFFLAPIRMTHNSNNCSRVTYQVASPNQPHEIINQEDVVWKYMATPFETFEDALAESYMQYQNTNAVIEMNKKSIEWRSKNLAANEAEKKIKTTSFMQHAAEDLYNLQRATNLTIEQQAQITIAACLYEIAKNQI